MMRLEHFAIGRVDALSSVRSARRAVQLEIPANSAVPKTRALTYNRAVTSMRYPPLLIGLFLALLLRPFTEHPGARSEPTGLFILLIFGCVIFAFRHIRPLALSMAVLGAAIVVLRYVGDEWQLLPAEIASHALSLIAMVMVMTVMLSEVLRARTASTDLVLGAVCLYIVIGLAWTFLYYSLYLIAPGKIFAAASSGPLTAHVSEAKFTEVLYFSLSALTTIGSSGEGALTPVARQLAVVESLMGQLYLAVLISRLVGFSTSTSSGTKTGA
jgi:hypothetical protein